MGNDLFIRGMRLWKKRRKTVLHPSATSRRTPLMSRSRCPSATTFFAWMAGFMGDMTITGPPEVREEYRKMLQQGLEDLEAAERESAG